MILVLPSMLFIVLGLALAISLIIFDLDPFVGSGYIVARVAMAMAGIALLLLVAVLGVLAFAPWIPQ